MRLYHTPGSRSSRVLWTLEEIGQPYDLTTLTWEQRRGEDHRRRHPLGRVPVLELDDGTMIFESAAICLQLADLHPDAGLIPTLASAARAKVYQWTLFAMTEAEPVVFGWSRARRRGEDETSHAEAFDPIGTAIRLSLAAHPWIAGRSFTIADILLASMLSNLVQRGFLEDNDPIGHYVQRATNRPAHLRANAIVA
jgi:glutathione S-transferase